MLGPCDAVCSLPHGTETGFEIHSLVLSLQGAVLMVEGAPQHLLNTEGSSQKGKAASTGMVRIYPQTSLA